MPEPALAWINLNQWTGVHSLAINTQFSPITPAPALLLDAFKIERVPKVLKMNAHSLHRRMPPAFGPLIISPIRSAPTKSVSKTGSPVFSIFDYCLSKMLP